MVFRKLEIILSNILTLTRLKSLSLLGQTTRTLEENKTYRIYGPRTWENGAKEVHKLVKHYYPIPKIQDLGNFKLDRVGLLGRHKYLAFLSLDSPGSGLVVVQSKEDLNRYYFMEVV